MGRKSHRQQLNVWMNGLLVGEWTLAHGEEIFAYHASWLNHPQTRPLSLSLPFLPNNAAHRGAVVNAYFDNLLPDSDIIRRRLAQHHRLSDSAPFTLLAALGRDCVGALQLLPEDETPQNLQCIIGEPLDDAAIAALLQQTVQPGLPGQRNSDADLRLSIAGAQEKTALLQHAGRWQRPLGSTPTTHIFKLPLGLVGGMQADMRSSVENEWLCAQLVAAFGLPVARCDIAHFEAQKVLVVERFDRRLSSDGRWLMRLPQEDLCQATATPPTSNTKPMEAPASRAFSIFWPDQKIAKPTAVSSSRRKWCSGCWPPPTATPKTSACFICRAAVTVLRLCMTFCPPIR